MSAEVPAGERGKKFEIEFSVEETDILRAVYSDRVTQLVPSGDTSALTEFAMKIAGWEAGTAVIVMTDEPKELVDELVAFHSGTGTAVDDLLDGRAAAEDIDRRVAIGKQAVFLAVEIGIGAAVLTLNNEMEKQWFKSHLHDAA